MTFFQWIVVIGIVMILFLVTAVMGQIKDLTDSFNEFLASLEVAKKQLREEEATGGD